MDDHFLHSSLRESMLEHLFLSELMRALWRRGSRDFEVLHAATDNRGYDVAVEVQGLLRHIQLKTSYDGARTARVSVNTALASKPSGCVIWMIFDTETLGFTRFYWFGAEPGRPIPDLGARVAKHTKGNAHGIKTERPDIRVLAKGSFEPLQTISDVADRLFGHS